MLVNTIFSFSSNISQGFFWAINNQRLFGKGLTLSQTIPGFYLAAVQVFENTVGKGEIACYEQFLFFPVFSIHLDKFLSFSSSLKLLSTNSFSMEASKICHLGEF